MKKPSRQFIRDYFGHLSGSDIEFLDKLIGDASDVYKKRKRDEPMSIEDKNVLKSTIFEIIRHQMGSRKVTKPDVSPEDIRLARLVHSHMYHGNDLDKMTDIMEEPLPYSDGVKTLSSELGDYDPRFSNEDMGVFRNPKTKEINVTMRGSRSLTKVFSNETAKKDWIRNFRNMFLEEKGTPEYKNYADRIKAIQKQFPDAKIKLSGFSKGGGLAISLAEDLGYDSKTFNPHINKNHNLLNAERNHYILRTDEDPATVGLGMTGRNKNVDVDSIPSKKGSNTYSSHSLNQFTTDGDRRTNVQMLAKADSHVSLTKFASMLDNLEYYKNKFPEMGANKIIEMAKKGIRPKAKRPATAEGFELEETSTTKNDFLNKMKGGDRRESGAVIRDTRRPTRLSLDSDFFDSTPQSEMMGDKPQPLPDPRMTEEFGSVSPAGREGVLNYIREQRGLKALPSSVDLPEGQARNYLESSPTERALVRSSTNDLVNRSNSTITDEYYQPMKDSLKLGDFQMAKGMAVGTAVGMGAGFASQAIINNIDPDMPQPGKDAITGSVAGVAGEVAVSRLAGAGLDLTRLGTGAISGGAGLVVGDLTTEAIKNAFGKSQNYYARDVTANIGGTIAGTATGIGVGIGIGTAAGIYGGLGAADALSASVGTAMAWNPVGWALLALSGATAIGMGVYEASQETKQAENQKTFEKELGAIKKTERTEGTAGQIVGLNSQYDYITDYLKSLGASNVAIAKVKNQLMKKIEEGKPALTNEEYQSTFRKAVNDFNLGGNSALTLQQTQTTQFQTRLSAMSNLVDRLKAKGIDVDMPDSSAYVDTENFTAQYNNIIAGLSKSQRKELGIDLLPPVYKDDFNQDIINPHKGGQVGEYADDLFNKMNASQREAFYAKYPNLAVSDGYSTIQDEFTLHPFQTMEQPIITGLKQAGQTIESGLEQAGQAISSVASDVGTAITTAFTPQNVPKATQAAIAQSQAQQTQTLQNVATAFTPKAPPKATQQVIAKQQQAQQAQTQKTGTFWQQFTGQTTAKQQAAIQASHRKK
jgi:hypothetical protein